MPLAQRLFRLLPVLPATRDTASSTSCPQSTRRPKQVPRAWRGNRGTRGRFVVLFRNFLFELGIISTFRFTSPEAQRQRSLTASREEIPRAPQGKRLAIRGWGLAPTRTRERIPAIRPRWRLSRLGTRRWLSS